jgi:hypothetical protein
MTAARSFSFLVVAALVSPASAQEQPPARTLEEIRHEATLPSRGDAGRPLPLAAHWNTAGADKLGFAPTYQLQLLKHGSHLLPWLEWPPTDASLDANFKKDDPRRQKYIDARLQEYEPIIKELARLRLPISFLATQWESHLTYDKAYFGLPSDKNPNVVGTDGKVQHRVCPFGPIEPWRQVGRSWTDNAFFKKMQEWYPDPPLVLLISNNEHAKLQWNEVDSDQRYLEKYGKGRPDDFKRKVVSDGWIERYGALIESMKAGLASEHWRKHVKFVGYEAFPPVHFGRWATWKEYSLVTPGRLDPQPYYFDGGSPSYYLHNWMALTDYTVWSPQVETMNWVFMLDEIHKTRPDFWFEVSTWDGDQPGASNDKRKFYARQGQRFTPERYEGFVQYGMWLTRPRVVREFRGYLETIEYAGPYFQPIVNAVDRVYQNPVLQKFWRKGTLVANRHGKHPYQAEIPAEYKDVDRWFLLDTNLTPKELRPEEFDNAKPPARQTEIPVFALALLLGTAPEREWLVFAHSPRHARLAVEVRVPEYGTITVDVPQSGSFYHVLEKGKEVRTLIKGGPASLRLDAPRFVEVGAPAHFTASEKFAPSGKIDVVEWDLGDGAKEKGDRVTHPFAKAGQYFVTATGLQEGKGVVHEQVPVFVGLKPEDGLVCRLLMKGASRQGMKSWIWLSNWDKVDYHFVPDASGAGNMGFLAGGTWVKDNRRGIVLELDGKHDRLEINNSSDINSANVYRNRTIAFWFRGKGGDPLEALEPEKRKNVRQVLFEEGGPGSGINVYLDGSVLRAGAWSQGMGTWLESKPLDLGAWHHVAWVLRGGAKDTELGQELYLDGQKIGEGKAPLLGQHPGDVNIGRSGNTLFHDRRPADQPGFYFGGRIDDFRLANRSFSADEVRALSKP